MKSDTTTFVVTGRYYNSRRRFSIKTNNAIHANSINLWCGSVWEVINGKRRLIKRVWN